MLRFEDEARANIFQESNRLEWRTNINASSQLRLPVLDCYPSAKSTST